jgi:hypothetical protein
VERFWEIISATLDVTAKGHLFSIQNRIPSCYNETREHSDLAVRRREVAWASIGPRYHA